MASSQRDTLPSDEGTADIPDSVGSPKTSATQRQSSIRFSKETSATSRLSMSRKPKDPDEITPIRGADGAAGRSYNGTDGGSITPASTSTKKQKSSSTTPAQHEDEDKDDGLPWYKRIADKYGSISLENKGSVARDHLALERTFLAWLRTSLAFASIGIAVTQLFRLNTTISSRSQNHPNNHLPYSPYLGQSIPTELVPYLQQAAANAAAAVPTLGPTLLDQLLLLPPAGSVANVPSFTKNEFDEGKAQKLRHVGKPLGATFLGISIVVLFIGFHRYFESQHWIIRGKFPAGRGSIFLVAFIAGALIVASLAIVLAVAPTSFEKK